MRIAHTHPAFADEKERQELLLELKKRCVRRLREAAAAKRA